MYKKFEKGTENYELFNDFWQLRQKYYEPDIQNNDDGNGWFQELTEVGKKIVEKYKGTDLEKLARNLVLAHLEDVEDRWKAEREKQEKA